MITTALATACLLLGPGPGPGNLPLDPIVVDCDQPGAFRKALQRASAHPSAEIRIDGVCSVNAEIARGAVLVRSVGPGVSALVARDPARPILTVRGADVSLTGLEVRGGTIGIVAAGWETALTVNGVEVSDLDVGIVAERGAELRVWESSFDGLGIGVLVTDRASANVQRSAFTGGRQGLRGDGGSRLIVGETTITDHAEVGIYVDDRTNLGVLDCEFHDNGEVHVGGSDYSDINVFRTNVFGSPGDPTAYAFTVTRSTTLSSFSDIEIHGDVSALNRGHLSFGNAVLHGDLAVTLLSTAELRGLQVDGLLFCADASSVVCRGVTATDAFGCPESCDP